jgi:uncharacterized membrane protein
MLAPAAAFHDYVLAVHILAVVVAFGVTFSYPLFFVVGMRLDPRAMPWFHRMQQNISRRIVSPGLGVILIAGIILASDEHQWKHFYVQWGIAIVIVIGALVGAVQARGEGQLADLAQRDVAAARDGQVTWSAEYQAVSRRIGMVGLLLYALVVLTVFFMALHL